MNSVYRRRFAAGLLCALCVTASAAAPLFAAVTVPSGVTVPVEVQSDATESGVPMSYKVTADVVDASGKVLIPAGSVATGRVLQKRGGGIWGQPGKVEVSLESVVLPDGEKVEVNAKRTRYGRDHRTATVLLSPLVVGFFIKGGTGGISAGDRLSFTTR